VKPAQRPLPSNKSQGIVILQCPNAAGSGSTMVVCGPLSGSPVTFIVPLDVKAGDYFELEEWAPTVATIFLPYLGLLGAVLCFPILRLGSCE